MKQKLQIIALFAPVIFIFDQWTKYLIVKYIPLGGKVPIINNFFDIIHAQNKGAAFGMLSTWDSAYRDLFFYGISVVAFCFLFYFLKQIPVERKWSATSIAFIVGGALGNLVDRFLRGSVVDFLSFHWNNKAVDWELFGKPIHLELIWPAFNVADAAITTGVFWLLIFTSFHQRKEKKVNS